MVDETQYFSIKRTNGWLWKTKLTRREVLEKLSLDQFPRDWLVCPLGEAGKAVDGERFASDPDIFSPPRSEQATRGEPNQSEGSSSDSRLCIDCGAPLHEIRLIDKGEGHRHYSVEYAALESTRAFLSGRYQATGEIQAYLCQSCGVVRLYAKPHD